MESYPKTQGKWKRIKLMRGLPVRFKDEVYFAPILWITEINPTKISAAQKDPRVNTRKGTNEEFLASLILSGCLLVRAQELITSETADARLEASDSGDVALSDNLLAARVFPEDDSEWYTLPEDMESPDLLMGDNKRISLAFRAINRLQEEELSDFFG